MPEYEDNMIEKKKLEGFQFYVRNTDLRLDISVTTDWLVLGRDLIELIREPAVFIYVHYMNACRLPVIEHPGKVTHLLST